MRRRIRAGVLAALLIACAARGAAPAQPASPVPAGQRIASQRCARCHHLAGDQPGDVLEMTDALGPSLAGAGAKYRPEWLRGWLAAPRRIRPAGYAPHRATVLTASGDKIDPARVPAHPAVPAKELDAVVAFLVSLQRELAPFPADAPGQISGSVHFAKVLPCAGCHRAEPGVGGVSGPELHSIDERVNGEWLRSFLADPRPWARPAMPVGTLRAEQVRAIGDYLLGGAAGAGAAAADAHGTGEVPPQPAGRSARLYRQVCAVCHGVRGDGRGINAPSLFVPPRNHTSDKEMAGLTDDRIFAAIKYGGTAVGKSALMPAWGGRLSDADVESLVGYVRSLVRPRSDSGSQPHGAR